MAVGREPRARVDPSKDPQAARIIAAARRLIAEGRAGFTTLELLAEAGVATNTFYRRFSGIDELLLAVVTEIIADNCRRFAADHADHDPVERLGIYIRGAVTGVARRADAVPEFVALELGRLDQAFPDGVEAAQQPVVDLLRESIIEAQQSGAMSSADPDRDAWFIMRLISSTYHHYAFRKGDPNLAEVGESLWRFCQRALGVDL